MSQRKKKSKPKSEDGEERFTSKQWWDKFLCWGGLSVITEPGGWPRHDWVHNWYEISITADEFLERARLSPQEAVIARQDCTMSDLEYYFGVVCRRGD